MNSDNLIEKQQIEIASHSFTLIRLDSCDSTNNFIRHHLSELTELFPVGISSRTQLYGRGRDDRTWFSIPGKGLYISLGLFINSPQYLNLLSLIAGISISQTLNRITNREFKLKWPNDVLYKGKKIAGILIENIVRKDTIISICGMGININHCRTDFPEHLKESAISAKAITGQSLKPHDIESQLIQLFFKWLDTLEKGETASIINTFRKMSHFKQGEELVFTQNRKSIRGRYQEINQNGGIELQLSTGEKKIYFSGEIETDL
jgi:BirA family biotin operon repressor/biotin-[acetyl-CoA-carboxylase] ligase